MPGHGGFGEKAGRVESLELLYRDQQLAVVNKPAGLMVHRSKEANDRVNCLTLLRDQLGQYVYPIHRLDRKTTGVLLFALDALSARHLNRQFQERRLQKRYLAMVRGFLEDQVREDPLDSKPAYTELRCLHSSSLSIPTDRYSSSRFSLVEARPRGGTYHQVRRHCKRAQCPVLGDRRRGDSFYNRLMSQRFGFPGMALHAWSLRFRHPTDERWLYQEAPVPTAFLKLADELGLASGIPNASDRKPDNED